MRFVSKTVTDGTFTDFLIGEARSKTIDRSEKVEELMNATYRLADGTISTKYQNSSYWAETPVYGHAGPRLGLWSITASPEYHNGGPLKQGQTVHDNVLLRVMTSTHFGASPVRVAQSEEWSKVYGPVFTYINAGEGPGALWEDARERQAAEAAAWPYRWMSSAEYVKERGTLTGMWKLKGEAARTGAWVVLAAPSSDWTLQSKGYEFWARTGPDGAFTIRNVIPGRYTLYVSGADQPEQYAEDGVEIAAGRTTHHDVEWTPARHGQTLWQIGTFDRTAAEFRNGGSARDFEMFKHYPLDFPEDVTFTIGRSDPARDWNYAQWALYMKKPVWTIRFEDAGGRTGSAALTLAFASAQPHRGRETNLEVKVNGRLIDTVHLPKTGTAGYRGRAQDSPWNVRVVRFDAALLRAGTNEITLGHADARPFPADGTVTGTVGQVMYDAIRLEVPPAATPLDQQRRKIQAALFVPDPLPPVEAESYGTVEVAPGVVADRVSYATAYGLRVPAIVYRPKQTPAGKMPGLVVVNGHGGDKYSWYSFYAGVMYAQAGAAVLTYDPIGEGERNLQRKNGTRQHDQTIEPAEMGRRMGGLMMTDVMQAVSYLAQRPDVDPKRLGAMGYSMGSFVLGLACAVETRLSSCVLVGGGNLDGTGGYWDSSSKKMCQAWPYQALAFLGDRGAVLYDLHADRGATLVFNGSADDVVSIPGVGGQKFFEDLRMRTIALHGSERNVFEFGFNPGTGHRPYFLQRPVALWLEKHLQFPNWTADSVAKMPETHIAEWAERNHVPMDKQYATEIREGGTRALGSGVPGVPHEKLDALPREKWEREKEKYIYETWVKRAAAR
jgi:rhamnogalacturonan endolyase